MAVIGDFFNFVKLKKLLLNFQIPKLCTLEAQCSYGAIQVLRNAFFLLIGPPPTPW